MTPENAIRTLAGSLVLAGLTLAVHGGPGWLLLAAFAGASLIPSPVTRFRPAELRLRRPGAGRVREPA